jgi:hypothetical protein
VLYLGEINTSQAWAWRKSIEVLDKVQKAPRSDSCLTARCHDTPPVALLLHGSRELL